MFDQTPQRRCIGPHGSKAIRQPRFRTLTIASRIVFVLVLLGPAHIAASPLDSLVFATTRTDESKTRKCVGRRVCVPKEALWRTTVRFERELSVSTVF